MKKVLSGILLWSLLTIFGLAHAGTVTYVYTDPQGTPLAEADASGNITATFEYTPYGTYAPQGTLAPGPNPNGPGYTGHVNDPETNLVYMQARYYDPATGHLISVDPVVPQAGDFFKFNRYDYAFNNPIGYIDPDGKNPCETKADCDTRLRLADAVVARDAATTVHLFGGMIADVADFVHGLATGNAHETAHGAGMLIVTSVVPESGAIKPLMEAAALKQEVATITEVTLSRSAQGEAAQHAADAIAAGKPSILTINRLGAAANRKAAIGSLDKVPGKQLDEYPPAMFEEGGAGASVRPINPRDNMSAGACIGNACRDLPNGAKVQIKIGD